MISKSNRIILVTGASGFIGRNFLNLLSEKDGVVIACGRQNRPDWLAKNVGWIKCDLLNNEERKSLILKAAPSHIVNLAWYTANGLFWNSDKNLAWMAATLDLAKLLEEIGGKHIVSAGSCAEYDWNSGIFNEETTPLNPKTFFGSAKGSCGNTLMKFAESSNITASWGRVFFVYGPFENQDRLVPMIIKNLSSGDIVKVTKGNQIRDYMHVKDVARFFKILLDTEFQGAVNIGSGEPTSIRSIIEEIGSYFGNSELIHYGALPERPNEPLILLSDTSKAKSVLNFSSEIKLQIGIRNTIEHALT